MGTTKTAIRIHPYLMFHGDCREAFEFYRDVLGGEIETMMDHAESPAAEHVPADWQDRILHASLRIGDARLMASDAPPGHQEEHGGYSISLNFADVAEGQRVFEALSKGGHVTMPFAQTFWAERFGMCTDRFGVRWMVNCAPEA